MLLTLVLLPQVERRKELSVLLACAALSVVSGMKISLVLFSFFIFTLRFSQCVI